MKRLKLKLWVKVAAIIVVGVLAYFLIQTLLNRKVIPNTTIAQINSVEMISSPALFNGNSVKITNLTDSGFNVVWVSEKLENGSVEYDLKQSDEMFDTAIDERITLENRRIEYSIHSIKISYLKPSVDYLITTSLLDGESILVFTPKTLSSPPSYIPISGVFETEMDISEALFIFTIVDEAGEPISTSISTTLLENNSWLTSIGDMRDLNTWSYMNFADTTNKIRIEVYTIDSVYTVVLELNDVLDKELELKISEK